MRLCWFLDKRKGPRNNKGNIDDSICHKTDKESQEIKTMANQIDCQETPKVDQSKTSETAADERLDHAAEDAAEKAGRTERLYDRDHGIFTK